MRNEKKRAIKKEMGRRKGEGDGTLLKIFTFLSPSPPYESF
jgi:hypothetical protein